MTLPALPLKGPSQEGSDPHSCADIWAMRLYTFVILEMLNDMGLQKTKYQPD